MRTTCPLRRSSGAGEGRIRLPFPYPGQKISRRLAFLRAAVIVGSGTSAAMPKPCRRLFGDALGPSMPTSAMVQAIFRWAVARDPAQRGLPVAFACAERIAWTNSKARTGSGGTGTSRQRPARRFRVRIQAALRSMSTGRMAKASETCPTICVRASAKVWSADYGARAATSRKRRRSSAARYLRPRA